MPIKLNNVTFNNGGTAKYNNTALTSIKYGSTQVWRQLVTNYYTIYNTSTKTGWWSSFGKDTSNSFSTDKYVAWAANSSNQQTLSPFINLTSYSKIQLELFCQMSTGGTCSFGFGFCPQSTPGSWTWTKWATSSTGTGNWQGPILSGTYDISSLTGNYQIKVMCVDIVNYGAGAPNIYLGNSSFIYYT